MEGLKRVQGGVEKLKKVSLKEVFIVFLVITFSYSSARYFENLRGGYISIEGHKYYQISKMEVSVLLDNENFEVEEIDLFGEKLITLSDRRSSDISIKIRIKDRSDKSDIETWFKESVESIEEKKDLVKSKSLSDDFFVLEVENKSGKYKLYRFFRGKQGVSLILKASSAVKFSEFPDLENAFKEIFDSRLNSIKRKNKLKRKQ